MQDFRADEPVRDTANKRNINRLHHLRLHDHETATEEEERHAAHRQRMAN